MARPAERCISSDIDLQAVWHSRYLVGCSGFRPIPQTTGHTCGPAALASVLRYLGISAGEQSAASAMHVSRAVGTSPQSMADYARRRGLNAQAWWEYPIDACIQRCRAGQPTLVCWADWAGHWVVFVGYEPRLDVVVLADPARPRSHFACHTRKQFERHWWSNDHGTSDVKSGVAVTIDKTRGGRRFKAWQGQSHPVKMRRWQDPRRAPDGGPLGRAEQDG